MNWIILAGLAVLLFAAAARDEGSWRFGGDRGSFDVRVADGTGRVTIKGRGVIDLAADGSGVEALADGGYLDVKLERGGVERRVRFENANGTIEKRLFNGRDEQPWTAEADAFVAELMPIVLRETAIDADQRVAWLIANRGQAALLDEIEAIHSDFAQRLYTVSYAESATIAPADFKRLVSIAESDMDSDFDLRTTLTAVLEAQKPTGDDLVALVEAGRSIGSDFDLRTLLVGAAARGDASDALVSAYTSAVRSIGSDFDRKEALLALSSGADLTPNGWRLLLESARGIGGDFECAQVLTAVAPRLPRDPAVVAAYRAALETVGDAFQHQRAAAALATVVP